MGNGKRRSDPGADDVARTLQVDDGTSLRHRAMAAAAERVRRPMCVVILGDDVGLRLLWELLGVRMSVGAVSRIEQRMSEAVAGAVDGAWGHARAAKIKHADGASRYRAGVMLSLWVVGAPAQAEP